ncbi:hypothetical protein [Caenimonas sedimenti]|uniref:hypothetical protein n=1 Tax=Caenimonas sedimenti TaxID=2596921 RepID=UPI0016457DFB|nr:hypothetical protein [Caenimonas sedimenti]
MPTEDNLEASNPNPLREDEPIPAASEDRVLDETARLAREGRKKLEADPREPKPASE